MSGLELGVRQWPGGAVTVPPVTLWEIEVVRYGSDVFFEHLGHRSGRPQAEPPTELYLREGLEFDADDPDAVAAFMYDYGAITGLDTRVYDYLPRPYRPDADTLNPRFGTVDERQRAKAAEFELQKHPGTLVSFSAVKLHVGVLRALVRHWTAHATAAGMDAVIEAWREFDVTPQNVSEAWGWFEDYVNPALQAYHVNVVIETEPTEEWQPATRPASGIATPNAFTSMVLQLVNDIADRSEYRTCPACGRLFSRQVGRTTSQHRRQGVRFCSTRCGNVFKQRQFHARRRQGGGTA
jgi:hypothetical protein